MAIKDQAKQSDKVITGYADFWLSIGRKVHRRFPWFEHQPTPKQRAMYLALSVVGAAVMGYLILRHPAF